MRGTRVHGDGAMLTFLVVSTIVAFVGYWAYALIAPRQTRADRQEYESRTYDLSKVFWWSLAILLIYIFCIKD